MKRLCVALGLVASVAFASAQSLPEYLRVRRQHGVDHAAGLDAVQSVDGSKVIELRGTVTGFFRQGAQISFLLVEPNGNTQQVDADAVPDWLETDGGTIRLLVNVIHSDPVSAPRVVLLGAAKDEDLDNIEAADAAKRKKAAAKATKSAGSQEPYRDTRSGLYGPIGRHVTRRQVVLPASQVLPYYVAFIKRENPHVSDAKANEMARGVIGYCIKYKVDARLVMAVVIIESDFDPTSVSHSGAMGLGQLMPSTAKWMGVDDPFDVIDNIYGMVKLLRTLIDEYTVPGRSQEEVYALTLAGYNAGEGAVRRHGGVPPYAETQAYVRRGLNWYYRLRGEQ